MFDQVRKFYDRMLAENDADTAMAFTLEQFEGLTEGQITAAIEGRI